jgi:hypothetical protein
VFWLLHLVLLLLWVDNMKVTTISIVGGWRTELQFDDGTTVRVGPVCNRVSDTWDWQRENLFNVVEGYQLMEAA